MSTRVRVHDLPVSARCACLQHGLSETSEALFAAMPAVAFFVMLPGPAAAALAGRLSAANLTHVYVLRVDLQTTGPAPMANDVLNPSSRHLTALQALRTSNEFFDLQARPPSRTHPKRTCSHRHRTERHRFGNRR